VQLDSLDFGTESINDKDQERDTTAFEFYKKGCICVKHDSAVQLESLDVAKESINVKDQNRDN